MSETKTVAAPELRPLGALPKGLAWLALLGTLGLMFLGGLVTTRDAGMAVPDYPLSFGRLNPPGWWQLEEVALEHSHRLVAATVGIVIILLTAAIWRGTRERVVRSLALAALGLVIVQGLLGGLRVIFNSLDLAIVHGILAHGFFSLLLLLAIYVTWGNPRRDEAREIPAFVVWVFVASVFLQLIVAAVMRHLKAGMAIPDFPLAFGMLWPPIETFPVMIAYTHRLLGYTIAVALLLFTGWKWLFGKPGVERTYVTALFILVIFQIALGARVLLGGRQAMEVSTHLIVAAAILGLSVAWATRYCRIPAVAGAKTRLMKVRSTGQRPSVEGMA
ncbi:MAG: COX15/CtaA family protein [Verrucomicrobiia bacterium]